MIIDRWILILCVIFSSAGCSNLLLNTTETATTQTYLFSSNFDKLSKDFANKKNKNIIVVAPPIAQAGFDTTGIAYITKPYRLDYYYKNQWIDLPQRMLLPLLVTMLETTGQFKAVLSPASSISGDLRIETEFLCLQHELLTKPSNFHVTLRVQLLDARQHQVIAIKNFDALEPVPSEDPYGGVIAANRAINRLLDEIANFVINHI